MKIYWTNLILQNFPYLQNCETLIINPLTSNVSIKKKTVNWLSGQINWLASIVMGTLVFPMGTKSALRRRSYEKVFWKYAANLRENTHAEVWVQ